jgi:hypothetical protein
VIEGNGRYLMPGMIDLHMHVRTQPMENEYVEYLKLAHGATTFVPAPDRGLDSAMIRAKLSAENRIIAPRYFPIWSWGEGFTRAEYEDPANAPRIAREMVARGAPSFGALTVDESGQMIRTAGIVHTIRDGVVIENAKLMEEVAKMVARSREHATIANPEWAPFLTVPQKSSSSGSGRDR